MLKKSRYYFGSLLGFMLFLSGLNRRIKEFFYKYCSRIVIKRIERAFKKIVNSGDMCILNLISDDRIEENLSKIKTDSIVNEADKYLGDYINILGSGWINIYPVNWHMDFKTGYIWQQGTFFRDYDQETLEVNCDVKVPRELSRFHHLLKVALAYKLTQNEKYASYCIEQINHWIDENPLMFSINWGCTMDVAIRAVNWIWILNFLTNSSLLTDEKKYKILKSLYEHGWYIYRNPEKGIYNNHNHYLGDLAGQIYLGLLFNRAGECERWLSEGMNELYREIRYQILPCGISYEKSTNNTGWFLSLL